MEVAESEADALTSEQVRVKEELEKKKPELLSPKPICKGRLLGLTSAEHVSMRNSIKTLPNSPEENADV